MVVTFFVAVLQQLAILLGVIICIISVQCVHRIGHLSHCCSAVIGQCVLIILCDVLALSVLVLNVVQVVFLGLGL